MSTIKAGKKCGLNLISGQLGSGKTTFLRQLLKQKPADAHWVILVNDFGVVGIDGAILSDQSQSQSKTQIQQIPGGCICCTAKNELTQTVLDILNTQAPDRILIEPTGLGEPQNLLDIFSTAEFSERIEIQSLYALFDISQTEVEEVKRLAILQSLVTMADVIVINKTDLATAEKCRDFQDYLTSLYPPKTAIFATQQAQIDHHHLNQPHFQAARFTLQNSNFKWVEPNKPAPQDRLTDTSIALTGCLTRQSHQSLDTQSIGWVFDHQVQFDWKQCQALFDYLADMPKGLLRAKGIFRVGESPRMLFQLVSHAVSRELIAYRKDSRLEILLNAEYPFDLAEFEQRLADSMTTKGAA